MLDQVEVTVLVARRLDAAGIPYMLTGSIALSYYAEPRFTRDIDVVVELPASAAGQLASSFKDDFYVDEEALLRAATRAGMTNLIHNATLTKIDLIVRKADPHHLQEFSRRRTVLIGDAPIWIVSPEDLLIAKLLWLTQGGSDVHRRDIQALLATGPALDLAYVSAAATRLGMASAWQEIYSDGQ